LARTRFGSTDHLVLYHIELPPMLAPTFKQKRLEQEINEDGFVHIPGFFSKEEIDYLLRLYESSHITSSQDNIFWNSTTHLPNEHGTTVSQKIIEVARPRFEQLFNDWEFPVANFMAKNPVAESECPIHRDHSIFIEDQFQYRNIWVPLIDVDESNGTLFVVPKSHLLFTECLPMFSVWPYSHLAKRLEKEFHALRAKAGDLVVYLERTLHGSYPNQAVKPRPAFHGGIIHKDASIRYIRQTEDEDEIEIYAVDTNFFAHKEFDNPDFKKKYQLVERRKYQRNQVSEEMVNQFYHEADKGK
jgi:hypothetical protein